MQNMYSNWSKMYKYDQFQLKSNYEEITSLKMNENEGLPSYFCYECAMLLYKFHKFKEKCLRGQSALKYLSSKDMLTYQAISQLDMKSLQSMLGIITVNERVKTFLIHDRQNDVIKRKFVNENLDHNKTEMVTNECNGNSNVDYDNHNVKDNSHSNLAETVNKLFKETLNSITDDFSYSDDNGSVSDNNPLIESDSSNLNKIFIPEKELIKPDEIYVEIKDMDHENPEVIKHKYTESLENKKSKNKSVKKRLMKTKNKKMEKIMKDNVITHHKFARMKSKTLDPSKWRKIILNEEEAVREFEKQAQSEKYLQAAYNCKDCYKFFTREDIMKRHVKLRHDPSVGPLECRFCRSRFTLKCYLRKHMRKHYTKYQCLNCNLVVAIEATALMHDETHTDLIRACNHCGKQFKHLSTFYTHLRTHRSKHVCPMCGDSFVSEAGLHQHKRVKHIADTPKSEVRQDSASGDTFCQRCEIHFETKQAYEEHLKTSEFHAELDASNTSRPRRRHVRLNEAGAKKCIPTTCYQCGEHFESLTQFKSHHYKQHAGTSMYPPGERSICEICGASLAPGSVGTHLNMHTRESLFGCELCERQFHAQASLKRHMVTHTGEKPYGCPLCFKRFTQNNSMKLHYRTFHLKQPYPKRNRNRKKKEIQEAVPKASDEESYEREN